MDYWTELQRLQKKHRRHFPTLAQAEAFDREETIKQNREAEGEAPAKK